MKLKIRHLHILIRAELSSDPGPSDEKYIAKKVSRLIKDTGMKVFMKPNVKYLADPDNLGLTFLAGLETSHTSGHFWTTPDADIMKYDKAALFQQDFYTCGEMNTDEVKKILDFSSEYGPKQMNGVIYDREHTLARPAVKIKYNFEANGDYETFLKKLKIRYLKSYKPD